MANTALSDSTAEAMLRRSFREARWAELFGSPPLGVTLARMASGFREGRLDVAMEARDEVRRAYSTAVGDVLSIGFICLVFLSVWAIGYFR